MPLDRFRTLGRSGLVVSPMALGAMTFGQERWGSDEAGSRAVFDAYVEAGGNFVDTAETYSKGRSEEMVGALVADRSLRERMVIATKFGWADRAGGPNTGGNGAKNIRRAVEGSLKRLRSDWIDLYWLHVWDRVTPAEEVLRTLGDLVRAGKVRYFGLSNVPAWYVAKMATLAQAHGVPGPIALQHEYSLVERAVEREHLPAAREFGLAVQPWSPLAGGLLTGRYRRADPKGAGGRLSGANPFGETKFTERNWAILDAVRDVAEEVGRPAAQVALAWTLGQPGIVAPILGASHGGQLRDNLAALDVALTDQQRRTLDQASAPEPVHPYFINEDQVNRMVFGADVEGWGGRA